MPPLIDFLSVQKDHWFLLTALVCLSRDYFAVEMPQYSRLSLFLGCPKFEFETRQDVVRSYLCFEIFLRSLAAFLANAV
jgi:hypothetical protein